MPFAQIIVYVLKSVAEPTLYYTGLTSNVAMRLDAHKCRAWSTNLSSMILGGCCKH